MDSVATLSRPSLDDDELVKAIGGGGAAAVADADEEGIDGFGDAFDEEAEEGAADGGDGGSGRRGSVELGALAAPEEIPTSPLAGPSKLQGAAPLGYHSSGFPIYGTGDESEDAGGTYGVIAGAPVEGAYGTIGMPAPFVSGGVRCSFLLIASVGFFLAGVGEGRGLEGGGGSCMPFDPCFGWTGRASAPFLRSTHA